MLNIEKYKEMLINMEIIDVNKLAVVNDKPVKCTDLYKCDECDFGGKKGCEPYVEEWLFSEYKEPEVDWSKVKIDTPILVKDILKSEWIKRYFAKYENGRVYVWKEGKTSWSAVNEHDVNSWKYAKLAESEE